MSSVWNTAESLMFSGCTDTNINDVANIEEVTDTVLPDNATRTMMSSSTNDYNICLSNDGTACTSVTPALQEDSDEDTKEGTRSRGGGSVGRGSRGRRGSRRGRSGRAFMPLPPAVAEGLARHAAIEQKAFKTKYKQMKRMVRSLVVENAALCDEVAQVQQKIIIATEERRLLFNKLRTLQSSGAHLKESLMSGTSHSGGTEGTNFSSDSVTEYSNNNTTSVHQKRNKPLTNSSTGRGNGGSNSSRNSKAKRLCPPITLDSAGRPIFPITLGPLTIHSLGEIVSEKSSYHRPHVIFPVGFCSSRTYASVSRPSQPATYTCKILDAGLEPRFEIVCEEPETGEERVFSGASPAECLNDVIRAINLSPQMPSEILVPQPDSDNINDRGLRFFGLSHPSVQNVLQACPGARKCHNYQWIKFEVCRSEAEVENVLRGEREAGLCHETLLRNIMFAAHAMC